MNNKRMERKKTFMDYLFRRSGFGRTSWPWFIIFILAITAMAVTITLSEQPAVRGVLLFFVLAQVSILLLGTGENWGRDKDSFTK